jgi:phage tail sheath protein FI
MYPRIQPALGIYALEKADLFNLLCIPPLTPGDSGSDIPTGTWTKAATYCEKRRALLIVDAPKDWTVSTGGNAATTKITDYSAIVRRNAAIYFPRVKLPDPLQGGVLDTFAPCGVIAGLMTRTDSTRGVWKAPAGIDAGLRGVMGLLINNADANMTDAENGLLNPLGINCLRTFPGIGNVCWGARTLEGQDILASEWKYVPVRRLALFLEESLFRGSKWIVFEPNDEPTWANIRLNINAFMMPLFRQGAFQGTDPKDAFYVKCDKETTTQDDINKGIVNIEVGFAPLKPAEFVVIKFQQIAGDV